MKNPNQRKITDILRGILVAFAILGLQGCAVRVGAYRFSMGENIQANLYIADNTPPPTEIFDPEVIIVENGIRHDHFFYQRHPEFYHRDRILYPERFAHRSHFVPQYQASHPDSNGRKDKHHDNPDHKEAPPQLNLHFKGPEAVWETLG